MSAMTTRTTAERAGERCFASRQRQTIIDVLDGETGLTVCYGKTLADCRAEYPDAEEMTVEAFCQWKAERQRTPVEWLPTTEARFYEMLECLPPAMWTATGFLVGEPYDHDALSGRPRYQAFRQRGNVFEVANRPMTREEFRAVARTTIGLAS